MVGGGAVWGLMDDMVDRWESGASRQRFRRGGSLPSCLLSLFDWGVEWYREPWGDREWYEMLHGRCWKDDGWACARWSRGIFGIFPA